MNIITQTDRYIFGQGNHYEIYNKLGAHIMEIDGRKGVYFAVWAPNATYVSVVGDFNEWDPHRNGMQAIETSGIWEAFIPEVKEWDTYKFAIFTRDGRILYKADPYAFHSELRPGNASKVANIEGFNWTDQKWIEEKDKEDPTKEPMSIYEVHLGSWQKDYERNEWGFIPYNEIAPKLAAYVKEMGYTHVEVMGISEHPLDQSWGYQVTGYFSPTSRYGGPFEFMKFVDIMHENGIGVILDWVPAHFPKDAHGLAEFDGTCLYEYPDPRKGEHAEWGTKVFNYEKNEVRNFLIANALYWVEKYHVDALRVDAVASMLYLDYNRSNGQWVPNKYGGNGNLEAMEFLKHVNSIMTKRNKRAFLIAEESTAWPKVTGATEDGGLGFGFKWNMGWMNDFLEYVKVDPLFKKGNHNKMTFGMTYAFSENFILVISHDEVVHLKCSMINKMPGYKVDKFANLKVAYTFMMGHPGKKLLFMGQEFGQLSEWSEDKNLEWYLLNEPLHKEMQDYVAGLLKIYKSNKPLYAYDNNQNNYDSFQWINCDDADRSIFSFIRKNPDSFSESLIFICNFTPIERDDYFLGVPLKGKYKVIADSFSETTDEDNFETAKAKRAAMYVEDSYTAVEEETDNLPYRLNIKLRPYEAIVLKAPKEQKKAKDGETKTAKKSKK